MGIDAEITIGIRADPDIVWGLLVDPNGWSTWWRSCVVARTLDRNEMREGSELELVLQPKHQKFTFRPMVDLITDERTLSLTHRSALVQTTTAWYLAEKPDRTVVTVQSVFNGLLPFLMSLAQQRSTVQLTLKTNLQGLRRTAERMVD